ncbi:hypothetical protein Tco_0842943 [Tanacetum coccineum]|uniref:Uncharacterized protein n=1 Tax=Tanacetum coccineum TaxID=301880 RepID=A0ABQ5B0N4_9ASTR
MLPFRRRPILGVAVVQWLDGDGWLCGVVRLWGGGDGVDEVVTMGTVVGMTRGGDGSGCHEDEGGDDGGGFGCGRKSPVSHPAKAETRGITRMDIITTQ